MDDKATAVLNYLHNAHNHYDPINFWDGLDVDIELAVEKGDLASLFAPLCRKFHVVRTNVGGWADLNCRASIMRRFAENERAGRTPILLNCGNHDPGVCISRISSTAILRPSRHGWMVPRKPDHRPLRAQCRLYRGERAHLDRQSRDRRWSSAR